MLGNLAIFLAVCICKEGESFLDFCFLVGGDVVLFCEFGAAFCGCFLRGRGCDGLFTLGRLNFLEINYLYSLERIGGTYHSH